MFNCRRLVGIGCAAAFILAATGGCKTTAAKVKDKQTDEIVATLPPGLVSVAVKSDEVEKYILPGDGSNGMPDTMNGIWWTDAHTVHFLLSFKNVVWDADTRTALLLFTGPGTYSTPATSGDIAGVIKRNWDPTFAGYNIVFNEDLNAATLLTAASTNGVRKTTTTVADSPYTMSYVSDGHWTRHSKGQPDYQLRRIVKADGTRDAAYADYLKAFGEYTTIIRATSVITDKAPRVTLPLTGDGHESYVDIKTDKPYTGIVVTAAGDPQVTFKTVSPHGEVIESQGGKSITTYIDKTMFALVSSASTTPTNVELSFRQLATKELGINGGTVDLDPATGIGFATIKHNDYVNGVITANTKTPVKLNYHNSYKATNMDTGVNHVIGVMTEQPRVLEVTAPVGTPSVPISVQLTPTRKIVEGGSFTVGTQVAGKLPNIYDVMHYTYTMPAGKSLMYSHIIQPQAKPACCLEASSSMLEDDDLVFSGSSHTGRSFRSQSYSDSNTIDVYVSYNGNPNAASPGLDFKLYVNDIEDE